MCAIARRAGVLCVLSLAAVAATADLSYAQPQQEFWTSRDYCVKVLPGKARDYEAFLTQVIVPLNRSRADAGEFEWFGAARTVVPFGSSARCDYRLAYRYKGAPPEDANADLLGAALKRAGVDLTVEQLLERQNALVEIVRLDMWFGFAEDSVGPHWQNGSYIRINHWKLKDGWSDEFVRLERTWRSLIEAWVKEGGKGSWLVGGLWLPTGAVQPYDAVTIDVFPDWGTMLTGVPVQALWPKVHPKPFEEVEAQKEKLRSLHTSELYRLLATVERGSRG